MESNSTLFLVCAANEGKVEGEEGYTNYNLSSAMLACCEDEWAHLKNATRIEDMKREWVKQSLLSVCTR